MDANLRLWEEPLYRLIIQFTIAQIAFLALIIVGILLIRAKRIRKRKRKEHISNDLYGPLMSFIAGDIPLDVAADVAKKYPRTHVCQELERYTIMLGGEALDRIRALYEQLDLRSYGSRLSSSLFWWRRLEGMRLLGAAGGFEVVDTLLDGLNDKHAVVRLAAARALGRIKHPASIEPILKLMANAKQVSRRQLAQTLVAFGPAAYPSFRKLVRAEEGKKVDDKTISTILEILAIIGDIESAPEIVKMLSSPNLEVRIAAFKAAIRLHIPLSAEELRGGLQDEEWPVRAQAAIASGKIGDTSIIDELGESLCDRSWWVRNNAGQALAQLGVAGIKKLESIYRESEDPFARDMAALTLTSDPTYELVPRTAEKPAAQVRDEQTLKNGRTRPEEG